MFSVNSEPLCDFGRTMKNVFLTGGNGDIGIAIKTIFTNNGYTVTAPSRQELDLTEIPCIKSFFEAHKIEADVFIHCAGFNRPKPVEEITLVDIQKTFYTNMVSFFEIAKAVIPYMRNQKKGHILGISSLYGSIARRGRFAYVTSKHALNGAMRTLACELGADNILVNTLSPGFVNTKLTRQNNSPETISMLTKKIPLNRLATAEEIARTAYWLCSDLNTYISGQDIIVDGGFMAEGGQNS